MNILRTIESFFPYISGPANQAYQISRRLQARRIHSPIFTTYCDVETTLPAEESIDNVSVHRFRVQARIMRYCISLGMMRHLKDFDILHSHNYRNFQTDCGFFLPN